MADILNPLPDHLDDPGPGPPPPGKKRTLAVRRQENMAMDFKVVKTTLNTFCKPLARSLQWEDTIDAMNQAATEAYLAMNVHVIRLCQAGIPIPKIDQTFCRNAIAGVSLSSWGFADIDEPLLNQSVELYRSWLPANHQPARIHHLSNWVSPLALQMVTNIKNMMNATLFKRFYRFIRHRHALDQTAAYNITRDILDPYFAPNPNMHFFTLAFLNFTEESLFCSITATMAARFHWNLSHTF
jgi:hypothetical protein